MDLNWKCWRDPAHPVQPHPQFGWPQCTVDRAAPDYHERPKWLPEGFELTMYVPTDAKATAILAPRSAVVGYEVADTGWVNVDFEGWINGPMQYADRDTRGLWEAGVEHAASRMVCEYPTIARAHLPIGALRSVGIYNPAMRVLTVTREATLNAWLEQS